MAEPQLLGEACATGHGLMLRPAQPRQHPLTGGLRAREVGLHVEGTAASIEARQIVQQLPHRMSSLTTLAHSIKSGSFEKHQVLLEKKNGMSRNPCEALPI